MALAFAALFLGAVRPVQAIRWNFNSSDEGWTVRNAIRNVGDGNLYVDPTGADPGAVSPTFSQGASASRVTIRMSSWCPDQNSRIYFTTAASPGFSESKSVTFSVSGRQAWTTYSVLMTANANWTGTITQIRIDPCDNGVGGTNSDIVGMSWVEIATTACTPVCTNKCANAADGCGGTCTDPCGSNQVCYSQTCTTISPSLSISPNPVNVGNTVTFTCSLTTAGAGQTVAFFVDNDGVEPFLATQQVTANGSGVAQWSPTAPLTWAPSVSARCRAEVVTGQPTSSWQNLTVNRLPTIDGGTLVQYRANGVTNMPVGTSTTDTTLVMKGTVRDPDGNTVQLEVEIRPLGTAFSGTPTCTGSAVSSASVAAATCSGLAVGSYHWQARPRDSQGLAGSWISAGGNPESSADFTIVSASAVPQLILPNDNATITDNSFEFRFTLPPGETASELWIDSNSGFGSPERRENVTGMSQFTLPANFLSTNVYYWKVRSQVGGVWRESQPRQFTYDPSPNETPAMVPLFRLQKATETTRDHFYTTNPAERDDAMNLFGYDYERIECYVSNYRFPGALPLMRLHLSAQNSHYYTTDDTERDTKIIAGYKYEGIAAFVWPDDTPGLIRLRRLRQTSGTPYHYVLVIRKTEYDGILAQWPFEDTGFTGRVSPDGLEWPTAFGAAMARAGNVDLAVGGYRQYFADQGLHLTGRGPDMSFTHHYNSLFAGQDGPMGPGWSHSLNSYLVEGAPPSRDVTVYFGDGTVSAFRYEEGLESYLPLPGNYDRLTRVAEGSFDLARKDQTRYEYRPIVPQPQNPVPHLTRIVDRYGNALTLGYNDPAAPGMLARATDAVGRTFTFTYGSYGGKLRLTQVRDDSLSRTLVFGYGASGRLDSFQNARALTTRYTYGGQGLLEKIRRPKGNEISVGYDTAGRVDSVTDGTSQPSRFSYAPAAREVTVTDPGNKATTVRHDENFSLVYLKRAIGNAATVQYYPDHPYLPWVVTDHRDHETTFTYDARGNVTSITNHLGEVANFDWDAYNNLTSRVEFHSGAAPPATAYLYDDPAGPRTVDITNPEGERTTLRYSAAGDLGSSEQEDLRPTVMGYDGFGNLETATDGEDNETRYTRDQAGRVTNVRDAEQKNTSYQYDANDNVTRVIDHDAHEVRLVSDSNDNLETISYVRTGPTGPITDTVTYGYDPLDRLSSMQEPAGGTWGYTYNDAGLLRTRRDPNNVTTTYDYDENQRLGTVQYPNETLTFSYDDNGNLRGVSSSLGQSTGFTYDALDRVETYTSPYGQVVSYAYHPAGTLRQLVYPGNRVVNYGYDFANRLKTVADWTGGTVTYGYNRAGNLTSMLNANGTRSTLTYDFAGRLTGITHRFVNGSDFARYAFTLDRVGNHLSVAALDPLAPPVPAAADITYSIGTDDRLLSETGGIGYGYDPNGNRISKSGPGGATTYNYDHENLLTRVIGPGATVDHVYDDLGNRITRSRGSATTRYVLDLAGAMSRVLMETDGANGPRAYYVYGIGLVARIDAVTGQRHTYHFDSRGSTVAITDTAQNLANRYAYDEFGAVLAEQGSVPNPFKYVGQWGVMAEPDGLQFMRARFYDERAGRFLTKDALGFEGGSWNLYVYAGSRPIMVVDPSGNVQWSRIGHGAAFALVDTAKFAGRLAYVTPKLAWRLWWLLKGPDKKREALKFAIAFSRSWRYVAGITDSTELEGFQYVSGGFKAQSVLSRAIGQSDVASLGGAFAIGIDSSREIAAWHQFYIDTRDALQRLRQ